MMKIATIAALIGSASAFAPAQTGKVRLSHFLCFLLLKLCVCGGYYDVTNERIRVETIKMHNKTLLLVDGNQLFNSFLWLG